MSQKIRVITWKISSNRYLHEVIVEGGYFHVVTNSSYFSLRSFTLRNKVLSKRSTKETRGLKKIKEEREEWLSEDEWPILCFGDVDNIELRKKVYGRELKKVVIKLEMYEKSRRIYRIYARREQDLRFSENLIWDFNIKLKLARNLRKRIRNPLPSICAQPVNVLLDREISKTYIFTVSELSYYMFLKRLKEFLSLRELIVLLQIN